LTVYQGEVVSTDYHDVVLFDDWARLDLYPPAPPLLQSHMDAPRILMRDVNWMPEFEDVADLAARLWRLGGNDDTLDGVIAVNQWALIDLVTEIGAIDVEGESIAGSDIMEILQEGTDEQGRVFTDQVFQAVLQSLTSNLSRGEALGYLDTFSTLLNRKDVVIHFFDPDENVAIIRAGWSGSITAETGDRVAVVDSNVGWNKVDRNISRSLEYAIDLTNPAEPRTKMEVEYYNTSSSIGEGCSNQTRRDLALYSEMMSGCYWNVFRVYVADDARLVSSDVLPLPENSVYHLLGLGLPGDDTFEVGFDRSGSYVSGLISVAPGETVSTSFELGLPGSVVEIGESSLRYDLSLIAQPGARGRHVRVEVKLPAEFSWVGGYPLPAAARNGVLTYVLDLVEDTEISIELERR
jgi:hypothetical protein